MAKKSFFSGKRIAGLILLILSIIVFIFRPFQSCAWWNLICGGIGLLVTFIAGIISLILLIIGIVLLIRG